MPNPLHGLLKAIVLLMLVCSTRSQAAINLASGSSQWTAIGGDFDYISDQQTGQGSDDIVGGETVGNDGNPAFLTRFEDNASGDDFIAFRVRMNAPENDTTSYDGYFWVAVEANGDGVVDAYIRATSTKGKDPTPEISIHSPGTFDPAMNVSPSTTTITATANAAYIYYNTNYMNYRAVATDGSDNIPGATDIAVSDIGGDSNPDWYVSIQITFQSLQAFLLDSTNNGGQSISIDLNTPLRYLVATSTQGNSLNQDIGGLNGGTNSTTLWTTDGFSSPMTPTGLLIPEPKGPLLVGVGGLLLLLRRRKQQ